MASSQSVAKFSDVQFGGSCWYSRFPGDGVNYGMSIDFVHRCKLDCELLLLGHIYIGAQVYLED